MNETKPSLDPVTSITTRPYGERQFVVVVDDAIVLAEKIAKSRSAQSGAQDWMKIAATTVGLIGSVAGGLGPVSLAVAGADVVVKALGRLRESGLDVLTLGRSQARELQFPPGHPRDEVLYIAHPAEPSVYFTTAQFHRLTFEHKFSEAIRLLMALGARTINVEHQSGWAEEFSANLNATLPKGDAKLAANTESKEKSGAKLLFKATLDGTTAPKIPTGLVWFPYEPTWKQIAEGRINYGLRNFSLSLRYEDDFGVNAGLRGSALKAGLDLGGRFEDHESTVWLIEGDFGQTPSTTP